MRKVFRLIIMLAVFLGGYYLGRTPGSPDLFDHAARACRRISGAGKEAAAKAQAEDTSLTEAVVSQILGESGQPPQQEHPPQPRRSMPGK